MTAVQVVYVTSTDDGLGTLIGRVFSNLPAAREYCRRQHGVASLKTLDRKIWRGVAAHGYHVCVHKMPVFLGAAS